MSSLKSHSRRLGELEQLVPSRIAYRSFIWPHGKPLVDALASASLTLADKPLMAIRLVGVMPGGGGIAPDPIYERDKHLLD